MVLAAMLLLNAIVVRARQQPDIVFIYADDPGYGDISCNGATKVHTPNIDRIAGQGIRFTNAHASSATCTPCRCRASPTDASGASAAWV
jgi:hypothetical protein